MLARPQVALAIAAGVAAVAIALALSLLPPPTLDVLSFAARHQFAWASSTTPVPISSVSVFAKSLLSRDKAALPPPLVRLISSADTIPLQPVRDYTNALRLAKLRRLCATLPCVYDRQDDVYGLTPLHLAAISGDSALSEWLVKHGADAVEDFAGRKPSNLSFANFIRNAKSVAQKQHPECDFPTVHFEHDVEHAKSEVRRLVNEGEPILMRAAYDYYNQHRYPPVSQLVREYAHVNVTVGSVPYANAFNLSTTRMKLEDYYRTIYQESSTAPSYVFNKHPEICQTAYQALSALVADTFPLSLISHPDNTGGLDGIHFFLGNKHSGAPFHVHADALNAAVSGSKQWYVYTPARTIYSRRPIKTWVENDLPALEEHDKPLECLQRAGDVVYVPLDWGHAVLNLEHDTFGVALEVLNRRDTLAHLWK
ncbi:JmjC domain-containing protein 8 [Gracilariopsis chorda]|uniref:JmjC domain-containing protein 8 n=1 Tax=Gracilariopsis chorda TaxID=448386 RepID=A0A2V3JAZ6_9FLOR|nr:JmjC domain-containing protein 8 [Gracilariopsis chorda]|eukprot:PXF49760.1 JmjC domain-containing protein 8 [Gracilariopsis chorda]